MGRAAQSERARRAAEQLAAHGQEHVLRFLPELPADLAHELLRQVEELDLPRLQGLVRQALAGEVAAPAGELQPPLVLELGDDDSTRRRDAAARAAGEELLRSGRVAAFLVAGGQGTRLGFAGAKGRFPVGPLTGRSLFAYHAHKVLATSRRHDVQVPYYVMTSRANDADTRAAFEEAGFFGLERGQVVFLEQGMLPAVDRQGRLLLEEKHALALSPDGHGGCFRALHRSGALADMAERGVEQLFSFQVDNPLARVLDPVFLGHHVLSGSRMSTKVVEKTDPAERVGVLARRDGRTCLVEYSDLDRALAAAREPDGRLRFRAGNIAIHVLDRSFVEELVQEGAELPVHRADKKVPHVDERGRRVEPEVPNAVKMEMFVFDALPRAGTTLVQEVRREDEFAPVKNASGPDSPETARAALAAQAKAWIAAAGLPVPPGPAEVGPLFALDRDEFLATLTRADRGPVFDRG